MLIDRFSRPAVLILVTLRPENYSHSVRDAGLQLADKAVGGAGPDRQHTPEQDQKSREETNAPDAVWLHGFLKLDVSTAELYLTATFFSAITIATS